MTTRRTRRVSAPPKPLEDERSYTEDDYAMPEPEGLSHAEVSYAEQMDWIPSTDWSAPAQEAGEDFSQGWEAKPEEAPLPEEGPLPEDAPLTEEYPQPGASPFSDEEEEYVPLQMEGYDPLYQSETDYTDDGDPLDEDLLTEEEQEELRRSHWQLLANLGDLAGVILGTMAILVLVMLLVSLLNWLVGDMSQSFTLLQKHF